MSEGSIEGTLVEELLRPQGFDQIHPRRAQGGNRAREQPREGEGDDDRRVHGGIVRVHLEEGDLELPGHHEPQAQAACSGEEAMRTFRQQDFNIMLMEARMPRMSGVRAFVKPNANVVMITAHVCERDVFRTGTPAQSRCWGTRALNPGHLTECRR